MLTRSGAVPKIARQPRRNKAIVAFAACVCLAVLPSAAGAAQETSSGKVAQFLDVPVLLTESFSNKPPSYCEYWGGKFRTESGQTITFFVETGLSGSPKSAKGLVPTDPGAIRTANTFAIADPEPKDAVLKISYVDSEVLLRPNVDECREKRVSGASERRTLCGSDQPGRPVPCRLRGRVTRSPLHRRNHY